MIIYTESDYLEAHLTEISSDSHNWPTALDTVPQLLTEAFKKLANVDSNSATSKPRPYKPRKR